MAIFVVFCVARTWIFEETGPATTETCRERQQEGSWRGKDRARKGGASHEKFLASLRCVAASGQTLSFFGADGCCSRATSVLQVGVPRSQENIA